MLRGGWFLVVGRWSSRSVGRWASVGRSSVNVSGRCTVVLWYRSVVRGGFVGSRVGSVCGRFRSFGASCGIAGPSVVIVGLGRRVVHAGWSVGGHFVVLDSVWYVMSVGRRSGSVVRSSVVCGCGLYLGGVFRFLRACRSVSTVSVGRVGRVLLWSVVVWAGFSVLASGSLCWSVGRSCGDLCGDMLDVMVGCVRSV